MNPRLERLHAYPFERLRQLHAGTAPPAHLAPISLSIGEPRHEPPAFLIEALARGLGATLGSYPTVQGTGELRAAAARWLERRYALPAGAVDETRMVLPVAGTREALYSFAQAVIDPTDTAPLVAMPNPFYQIYEGAALLAGAEPYLLDTWPQSGYRVDLAAVPAGVWDRCSLLYLCSPGNPTGAVAPLEDLKLAVELAHRHDFVIAADECYADIYPPEGEPPPGMLGACRALGLTDFSRVVVFHSLSKRSSVPGLRSGFVAGDPALLARYQLYRTYHGCALPLYVQAASALAWNDDAHAAANRALYAAKFAAVVPILADRLEVATPPGAFYLWAGVADDLAFARGLQATQNVAVLPGTFLGREGPRGHPGRGRVRISLVAGLADCITAAHRIRQFVEESADDRPLAR